jgi:pyruvate dehydrogenase E1 component alpha subunit
VDRAREGRGPSFLEFETYRWREHCGPNFDNDLGYRTEDEYQEWKARDPIKRFKAYLVKDKLVSQKDLDEMVSDISKEIDGAFAFAKESPFPGIEIMSDKIHAP